MFCKNCGENIEPDTKTCPKCGKEQTPMIQAKFFNGKDEVFYSSWTGEENKPATEQPGYDANYNFESQLRYIESRIDYIEKEQKRINKSTKGKPKLTVLIALIAIAALIVSVVFGILAVSKIKMLQNSISDWTNTVQTGAQTASSKDDEEKTVTAASTNSSEDIDSKYSENKNTIVFWN